MDGINLNIAKHDHGERQEAQAVQPKMSAKLRRFVTAYRRYETALASGATDDRLLELAQDAAECLNTRFGAGRWNVEGGKPTKGIAVGVFWLVREAISGRRVRKAARS